MTSRTFTFVCASLAMLLFSSIGMSTSVSYAQQKEGGNGTMQIQSSAFAEGQRIPKQFTCEGEDISPPLTWSAPPSGTKSLVLICDDPDAPMGTWVHWVVYGLPPSVASLPQSVPTKDDILGGGKQGRNDFGNIGYGGPCPPPGSPHRYFFKLYAVDMEPALSRGATKADVMKAIEGHILAEGKLMGKYGR